VHIASLAPGLVASGLFGHERGAFTGATEQTKGRFELRRGTLLLDEVGGCRWKTRSAFAVLQEGTFERVAVAASALGLPLLAATNRDLKAEVRRAVFARTSISAVRVPHRVPPLRERREEIPRSHYISWSA